MPLPRSHSVAGLVLFLAWSVSCSVYFGTSPDQCSIDTDCPAAGTVCNRRIGVCVESGFASPPPGYPDAGNPSRDGSTTQVELRQPDGGPPDTSQPDTSPPDTSQPDTNQADTSPPDTSQPGPRPSGNTPADAGASTGVVASPCPATNKPLVRIEGMVRDRQRLSCHNDYLLIGSVFVQGGGILTIDPGTTILLQRDAVLVVQPGGRIEALGLQSDPVVFTSSAAPTARRPGDWGGLIILGRASIQPGRPRAPGLASGGEFGGSNDEDDSGILRYVRIEYGGASLGENTYNGERTDMGALILAGVGRGTTISHVQVRQSGSDCFNFLGGTVNAKHLVCQQSRGDGFDWEQGYRGKLQFLLLQQDGRVAEEDVAGLEADNDETFVSGQPVTEPTVYNVSLCATGRDFPGDYYGMLIGQGARPRIFNALVVGFDAGIDLRDRSSRLDLGSALISSNLIAYEEDGSNSTTQADDDGGLDEVALFLDSQHRNRHGGPEIGDCASPAVFGFYPQAPIVGDARVPPNDGFFEPAAGYLGAVRDRNDSWTAGGWVVWSDR